MTKIEPPYSPVDEPDSPMKHGGVVTRLVAKRHSLLRRSCLDTTPHCNPETQSSSLRLCHFAKRDDGKVLRTLLGIDSHSEPTPRVATYTTLGRCTRCGYRVSCTRLEAWLAVRGSLTSQDFTWSCAPQRGVGTISVVPQDIAGRFDAHVAKFLRKHLGWSGADFARHMGVAPETVSRWENGREPMGGVADRLVRLMVVTQAPKRDYAIDALAELEDEASPARIKVAADRHGWHTELAA